MTMSFPASRVFRPVSDRPPSLPASSAFSPSHALRPLLMGVLLLLVGPAPARADWPQWGGRAARNMVSSERGLPVRFEPGRPARNGSGIDPATTRNVRWVARLGTQTYGSPAVAGGRVFVGTNNGHPRDSRLGGDRGVLMCLDEQTGEFRWQLAVSKLRQDRSFNGDFPALGVCSSPTVEEGRLWIVTSRCEVLCLDVDGLADGNDGPFRDEGEYIARAVRQKPGKQPPGGKPRAKSSPEAEPRRLSLVPTDADIIWRFDMIAELDVWPQDASDCSVLVRGDLVYAGTSNGVDKSHVNIPSPRAPSLIALEKRSGKLVAVDDAGIGPRIFHGQWSSPSLARVAGRELLLYGGGDGFCYAFDPDPRPAPGGGARRLETVWRCDANPSDYRLRNGKPIPYNKKKGDGPSEIISTPAVAGGRVFVTVGQDTRHGPGKGALTCIDPSGHGDVSATHRPWTYRELNRSLSTPSVAGDLVFVADVVGDVHCLDSRTGKPHWVHRTGSQMMGSTLVADGKVWAGNKGGKLTVLAASAEERVLAEIRLGSPMDCAPVASGGTLFIASHRYLWAVEEQGELPLAGEAQGEGAGSSTATRLR